jgi:tRNA(Arg) A34 adenosine deaminase TadA
MNAFTENDFRHLDRCVQLAREALAAGDEPFGSVLVSGDGEVLAQDRNRVVATGDRTQHPEINLARWAAANMTPEKRARATVYTSGEHCPMCAAAHGWVGLGHIVYAASSAQLGEWLSVLGVPPPVVATLPIQDVAPQVHVRGPVPELETTMRELHEEYYASRL